MRFTDIISPKGTERASNQNACPICFANIRLTEVEPHPNCEDWDVHGYSCDNCGPVKSLVVQRSVGEVPPSLMVM